MLDRTEERLRKQVPGQVEEQQRQQQSRRRDLLEVGIEK